MHVAIRSLALTGATAACVATAVLPTVAPTPSELLAAAQTLYMRGTKIGGDADTSNLEYAVTTNNFITYTACGGTAVGCDYLIDVSGPVDPDPEPVDYPAEFWPITGGIDGPTYGASVQTGLGNLSEAIFDAGDDDILVYGYSQSAVVASLYMREHPDEAITYVLLANPMRPNGGILQRFYGLGTIPIVDIPLSGATPTSGAFTAYDITRQYDGWADFPNNPANPLATANAIAGIIYLHGRYNELTPADIATGDSWTYGQTTYYTIDTPILPLLLPLQDLGVPVAVLAGFDAPLRVLVEAGYDRSLNPGVPATANIFLGPDPITLGIRFVSAIPVGIDDGIELTNGTRPLGTEPAGMYGVGVPENDPVATTLSGPETQRAAQDAPAEQAPAQQAPAQQAPAQDVPLQEAEELQPSGDADNDQADAQPTRTPSTNYLSPGQKRLQELARTAFGDQADHDRPLSHFVNRVLGHNTDRGTEDTDDDSRGGISSTTQDDSSGPSSDA